MHAISREDLVSMCQRCMSSEMHVHMPRVPHVEQTREAYMVYTPQQTNMLDQADLPDLEPHDEC